MTRLFEKQPLLLSVFCTSPWLYSLHMGFLLYKIASGFHLFLFTLVWSSAITLLVKLWPILASSSQLSCWLATCVFSHLCSQSAASNYRWTLATKKALAKVVRSSLDIFVCLPTCQAMIAIQCLCAASLWCLVVVWGVSSVLALVSSTANWFGLVKLWMGCFWLMWSGWLWVSALRETTEVIDLESLGSLGAFGWLVWSLCLLRRAHCASFTVKNRDCTATACFKLWLWLSWVNLTVAVVVQIITIQTIVWKFRFAELDGEFVTRCGCINFEGGVSPEMLIDVSQYWTGLVLVCQSVGLVKWTKIRVGRW